MSESEFREALEREEVIRKSEEEEKEKKQKQKRKQTTTTKHEIK